MIIVDTALRQLATPLRVAIVGTGFMARGLVRQIVDCVPGMEVAVVVGRRTDRAWELLRAAGVARAVTAADPQAIDTAAEQGVPAVVDDPLLACAASSVDAVVEVTGAVDYGARVVGGAIAHGKHVVLMNAEVDATVGPLLKRRADAAGVVYTGCDGDQPGVQLNLYRFVLGLGLQPLVCGNVKGLHDVRRNPTTQEAFARRWGQSPYMVTSFADGTKVSFEQAIVANATGMRVARRGMTGRQHSGHVDELIAHFDIEELREHGGVVDYVVGASPGPGVFVLAAAQPSQRHYLELFKLGTGPLYSFYTPYHLCHLETPASVARAVLFGDATIAPRGGPLVEVVATAKVDLQAGQVLDGLGGYLTYGQCENADVAGRERLLPMGVAQDCRVRVPVRADSVLSYDDVELPEPRLVDALRAEQELVFAAPARPSAVV